MTNFCERCNGSGWADATCDRLCDDCNGNGVVDPAKPTLLDELSKLRAEIESLRKQLAAAYPFKPAKDAPTIGYTGCLICGQFTDHGGLQCPKLRAYSWCNSSPENS